MKSPQLLVVGALVVGITIVLVMNNWTSKQLGDPSQDMVEEEGDHGTIAVVSDCTSPSGVAWNFNEQELRIDGKSIGIAVADLPEEKQKGLGNCPYLPDNYGMYFTFDPAGTPTFWMKDTLIPLDIVWVLDGKVLEITQNIQTEPGVADGQLKRYAPSQPVDGALELAAGTADKLGIAAGQEVSITSPN